MFICKSFFMPLKHKLTSLLYCMHNLYLRTMFAGNGSIQLVGGATTNEGRIEIYLNYFWGTVCDNSWDILDAVVACRQLGYSSAISAHGSAYFGAGIGVIHYSNVACKGTEEYLVNCSHRGIGMHYCRHRNDAGVVCDTRPNASKLGS